MNYELLMKTLLEGLEHEVPYSISLEITTQPSDKDMDIFKEMSIWREDRTHHDGISASIGYKYRGKFGSLVISVNDEDSGVNIYIYPNE